MKIINKDKIPNVRRLQPLKCYDFLLSSVLYFNFTPLVGQSKKLDNFTQGSGKLGTKSLSLYCVSHFLIMQILVSCSPIVQFRVYYNIYLTDFLSSAQLPDTNMQP